MTEDDDGGTTFVIGLRKPPAGRHDQIENVLYRSGIAFENCVFYLAILILHRKRSDPKFRTEETDSCGNGLHMRQLADGFRILESQLLARAHLFSGPTEGKWLHVIGKDNVGTDAGHDRADVVVESGP